MRRLTLVALLAATCLGGGALAQPDPAATGTSKPQPLAIADTIPAPRDLPYPGTIRLRVDATDTAHGVFRVAETIPVQPGALTLLLPKWLPGDHAPTGTIDKLSGLTVSAAGRPLAWRRDPVDITAFHLDVPAGAQVIEVTFQYLSPTAENQGRVVMTPEMLNLQWNSVALYPAGYFTRGITMQASATYPAAWRAATALRPAGPAAGGTIDYRPVAFDTLVDSPVFAGKHARIETLSPRVTLNIFGDHAADVAATPAQLDAHKRLLAQALKTFGAQHYDHYDFLLAVTDRMGGIGLEHHRSSEDGTGADYFTDWDKTAAERDLLAHEFTHSWNGKFRRPADLWTPDYRTPMRDSLLWVYEGQTQFWGNVLAARAGLVTKAEALDALAATAATYEYLTPGRAWRPLVDTTSDEIINPRRPQAYRSEQRFEDYYQEGQLIWLEVDSLLRQRSGGRRSLDDFARAFFGVRDGDWGELTYTFDDVIATLKAIDGGYDWSTFLHDRVDTVRPHAPLEGIARGGYRLVFTDQPTGYWKSAESVRKSINLSYSLGLSVGREGAVTSVIWDGPAYQAGIAPGARLVAVDGETYSDEVLKAAITAAKGGTQPIRLLVKTGDAFRTVDLTWTGGLRYPRLERTGRGPSSLDALYAARR